MTDDFLNPLLALKQHAAPLRLFALADAAQGVETWQSFRAHSLSSLPLLESHGPNLDPFSPHLLDFGVISEQNKLLQPESILRHAHPSAAFTLVCSPLSLKQLHGHLKFFWNVRLSGGLDMILAFWDPAVLGVLVGQEDDDSLYVRGPVLNEEQKRDLLQPIANWQYRDREARWHSIVINLNNNAQVATHPLTLTQEQEDQLVEASLPDQILSHLEQDQPHLLDARHPRARYYRFVCIVLTSARLLGLTGMRDLVNFTALCLIYRQRVETDSRIVNLLNKVQRQELTFDQALELMPD